MVRRSSPKNNRDFLFPMSSQWPFFQGFDKTFCFFVKLFGCLNWQRGKVEGLHLRFQFSCLISFRSCLAGADIIIFLL